MANNRIIGPSAENETIKARGTIRMQSERSNIRAPRKTRKTRKPLDRIMQSHSIQFEGTRENEKLEITFYF